MKLHLSEVIKMAKKNSIFSSDKEYKSTYYFKQNAEVPVYRRWNGRTAHKKIKDMIDELDDADIDKFREYYEDLGEDYDASAKYKLYDIVDEIKRGKSMDEALERNRLFKGEDVSTLKKNKPKSHDPIVF